MVSDAVGLTQRLVQQDTVGGNETRCAAILQPLLSAAGFRISEIFLADGRPSFIAELAGRDTSRKPLGFTGHLDTVPLGTKEWSYPPLAGEIVGDRIFGRGSSDMKGGVAAFIQACLNKKRILQSGAGVVLIITAGEETGCEGAMQIARDTAMVRELGALVVAEPTSNYPVIGHKGVLWLRAVARGVTAHGSMPQEGINAVEIAAKAVLRLLETRLSSEAHPVLGRATLNVGTFHGGLNINSVPDRAEFTIDIRSVPGRTNAELHSKVKELLGVSIELSTILQIDPLWTDPKDWIEDVFEITQAVTGEAPKELRGVPYFTDAAPLKPAFGNAPTIILGPGEPQLAHQTDEYCLLSRIDEATAIYESIIEGWNRAA